MLRQQISYLCAKFKIISHMTKNRQLEDFNARLRDFENRLEALGGVDAINERIESIAAKLYSTKEVLTLEEASLFLGLSKSQLYKLTASAAIPHYKPGGKYIYFDYVDLIEWVRQNPVKSKRQHELDAVRYVTANPIKKR